jgi:hypothetical protein
MEKDDRRNGPILTKVESTQIFGNIEEIYHLHLAISEQLDRALNEDACIGSVFLANVSLSDTTVTKARRVGRGPGSQNV